MITKFCAILSLILILAKIFGLITLSWLVCLLPMIILIAVEAVMAIACIVIATICAMMDSKDK